MVGPVVAWSCLCLVKLCGTHLTSAFSVSGIHCSNYAIMSLYSLTSDCTPSTPHPRSGEMPQLDFFFLLASLLLCSLFLVLSVWLTQVCCTSYSHFVFYVSQCGELGFGSQLQSTRALWVAFFLLSALSVLVLDVCLY